LSVEARLTMSNMAIEAGGKSGIIEADGKTEAYVKSRTKRPYKIYKSDPDASYVETVEWDVTHMEPQIARPSLPSNTVGVSQVAGTKVDQVFLGSCTNGRIEDLRVAAAILKGRQVAPGVRLIVIPATHNIYRQAMKEGLLKIFSEARAAVSTATCGPCLGGHMGVLAEGEVCLSTSNRNFPGRMGHKDAPVYLANPAVAAATAVAGCITHPDDVVKKSGRKK
ncbi:MAG TPA: aconitase family protein, partial [Elusimicrobiota bacterium]|nr:aconitase family protein [Elusimicrobiota bacterium]